MTTPTLRELGPHDGPVLDAVFAGLSRTSRYLRFHGGVPALSPSLRAVLAAVDGRTHLAVAAFDGDEPIGIARLVRGGARPDAADLAVEVVDAHQGRGVGTRLVEEVLAIGAARGVRTVEADVRSTNAPMLHLLTGLLPGLTKRVSGTETHVTAGVPMNPFDRARLDQHRADLLAAARTRGLARPTRTRRPRRPVVTLLLRRTAAVLGGDTA